jgi:multiple sugar transport system substrate-binding protein
VVSYNGQLLKTTIGGTGISVSAFSKYPEIAVDFARMVVSGQCQRTMYVQHGGQPGHRSAWTDREVNRITNNFFSEVLPVMENGYLRPRYNGYLHFQDLAGDPLQECLKNDGDPLNALQEMNNIYRESIKSGQSIITV